MAPESGLSLDAGTFLTPLASDVHIHETVYPVKLPTPLFVEIKLGLGIRQYLLQASWN